MSCEMKKLYVLLAKMPNRFALEIGRCETEHGLEISLRPIHKATGESVDDVPKLVAFTPGGGVIYYEVTTTRDVSAIEALVKTEMVTREAIEKLLYDLRELSYGRGHSTTCNRAADMITELRDTIEKLVGRT